MVITQTVNEINEVKRLLHKLKKNYHKTQQFRKLKKKTTIQ